MSASLATSSPFPSKPSTPISRSSSVVQPPQSALPYFATAHSAPPTVQKLSIPVRDEYGGNVTGFLHLPSSPTSPTNSLPHSKTAAILLSGAGGGVTGPSAMYLELAAKLPALEAHIPVLRLDYRYAARTLPCVADTLAAIQYLQEKHSVEQVVLVGWSFGGAPVFTVAGQDERVVGTALVAPQTADALQGARECGRRSCPVLLLHGTGDRCLSPRCSEGLYEAWWSKRQPGEDAHREQLSQLILYEGDDHALSHNAVEAEGEIARFILRCVGVAVKQEEVALVDAELVDGGSRAHLMQAGGDLRGREQLE